MSDCGVCLGEEFEGPLEFERRTFPKARKVHECCECHEDIPVGKNYEYVACAFDGEFKICKTCLICCEIRSAFTCDPNTGIIMGELWDEIKWGLFPHMTTGCLQRIRTAEAKEFLITRWNEWKFGRLA
jgi:hypothetical protein